MSKQYIEHLYFRIIYLYLVSSVYLISSTPQTKKFTEVILILRLQMSFFANVILSMLAVADVILFGQELKKHCKRDQGVSFRYMRLSRGVGV